MSKPPSTKFHYEPELKPKPPEPDRVIIGKVGEYFIWAQNETPAGKIKRYGLSKSDAIPPLCLHYYVSVLLRQKGL